MVAVGLITALLTLGVAAAADGGSVRSPSAPTPDAAALADHVRRGDRARLLGRWADAAAAYAEALATAERAGLPAEKRVAILGELGAAEVSLEKYRDGAEHLHRSLLNEGALTTEQKDRYRKASERATREIAVLVVAVSPADAELVIDDTPIPERTSGHVLFVEPGQHTLRARLAGYVDGEIRHNAPKGTEASLALRLVKVPPPPRPTPRAARVEVVSEPGADGWQRFRVPVLITAGGALLLGGGLYAGAVAVDDALDRRTTELGARIGPGACNRASYQTECNELRARVDAREALVNVGRGALIVGAALGVVGIGSFAFGSEKDGRARVGLGPGGIALEGEF